MTVDENHVSQVINTVLLGLDELLAIRNSDKGGLLVVEIGNISAICAKAGVLGTHMLLVERAA